MKRKEKKVHPYKNILQVYCNLHQIPMPFFMEIEKVILKFVWNYRGDPSTPDQNESH